MYLVQCFNTVAMGRCQSTPGLVESCGRTTLEDMDLPSAPSISYVTHYQQQQHFQAPSLVQPILQQPPPVSSLASQHQELSMPQFTLESQNFSTLR